MKNLSASAHKNIYIYLKNIYGINKVTSLFTCNQIGVNFKAKFLALTNIELTNIQNLIAVKCYRGKHHFLDLPVQGQRTRDNAKIQKRLGLLFQKFKKLTIIKKNKKVKNVKL